jgi:hypothetical protein
MAHGRKVVQGVVVGLGLLGAVLGGALAPPAHDLGPHPAGIQPMAVDGLEPTHPEHGHDEHRAGPPDEFPGRHMASATGVNVVAAGSESRAAASGPGALAAGACVAVVLLGYGLVVGLTAATRRIRTPAF